MAKNWNVIEENENEDYILILFHNREFLFDLIFVREKLTDEKVNSLAIVNVYLAIGF